MPKRSVVAACVVTLLLSLLLPLAATAQTAPPPTTSLLVKLIAGLTTSQQDAVIARNGGVEVSSIPALRLHVVAVATEDVTTTLANYQVDPQVQSVEINKTRQSET